MTEQSIQNWLYNHARLKNHIHPVPNIFLYEWESDFISVTKTGFVHEFEIKISRADFKHDKKKVEKHGILKTGDRAVSGIEQRRIEMSIGIQTTPNQQGRIPMMRPNYFWYVCPKELIQEKDVPDYAGLLWITWGAYGEIKVPAPLLHKDRVTDTQITRIAQAFRWKYWNLRLRKPEKNLQPEFMEEFQ